MARLMVNLNDARILLDRLGDVTLPLEELVQLWEQSEQTFQYSEVFIYANTPMCAVLQAVEQRFQHELARYPASTQPILLLLSDGEPTDGDPRPLAEAVGRAGITVVTCFITAADMINPRTLFGQQQPHWNEGARRMFEMSSRVDLDSALVRTLRTQQWIVESDARLFMQVNHSQVREEVINSVLQPLVVLAEAFGPEDVP